MMGFNIEGHRSLIVDIGSDVVNVMIEAIAICTIKFLLVKLFSVNGHREISCCFEDTEKFFLHINDIISKR